MGNSFDDYIDYLLSEDYDFEEERKNTINEAIDTMLDESYVKKMIDNGEYRQILSFILGSRIPEFLGYAFEDPDVLDMLSPAYITDLMKQLGVNNPKHYSGKKVLQVILYWLKYVNTNYVFD